ncbi:MAG: hypothetical protein ABFE01_22790 [Phycisphaerales bacterium]|jgi:hypothetical protein
MLLCLLVFAGCERKAGQTGQAGKTGQTDQTDQTAAESEQVKTPAEYKAEADKQITQDNMSSELDSLEKEIDSDAAAAPTTP